MASIDIIRDNTIVPDTLQSNIVVNRFISTPKRKVIVTTDFKGIQEFKNGKLIQTKQASPTHTYADLKWLNDSLLILVSETSIMAFDKNYDLVSQTKKDTAVFLDTKVYYDSKKRIWAATNAGLQLIDGIPKKNIPITFTALPPPFDIPDLKQKKIFDLFEDAESVMWFATAEGIVKVNTDGSHQLITVKNGLPSNIVTSIFQDKEKNLWFGTAGGLAKLITRQSIRLYPMENGFYVSDYLHLLYPFKKNKILIGTTKGSLVFDKSTADFTPVANNEREVFYSVISKTAPVLLLGVNGMATFDSATFHYSNIFPLPLKLTSRIISDKDNNLFVSNTDQLFFISGKTQYKVLDSRASSLLIDKKGDLWVGTWQNGLFRIRYSFTNNRFTTVASDHYLLNENIRCLYEDASGNIWVGTRYQGVYRFMKNEKDSFNITNFSQSNGLSSNFVRGIREDANGNYWIAFYQGLDKLIPHDSGFRVFNFSRINNYFAGIIGIETDADHALWIATTEGLAQITDGEMEKLPPLPVYITKIFSPDSSYPVSPKQIQLNYLQNQLQFEFSAPSYINEKQVLYSYRLSGSSAMTWSVANNQHSVSYASLQPGSYLFEVRTLGWNGDWGSAAKFEFIIRPPFWKTWWFITALFILIGYMIYWLIRKRIKAIRHEAAMKQKIAETETIALRAQMNPHFIFNCLNSIDNLIQINEREKATLYLSKFAKLIRSILENSVNNAVPCWKDMETLQLYLELEALRFDNKFTYQVSMSDEIQNGDYKVPPLVIQPFVENAIHHGLLNKIEGDKKLLVTVSVSGNHIHYIIQDNGVGRATAAAYKQLDKPAHSSMGMQITADRIDLFNQRTHGSVKVTDLYDDMNSPVGTKVEVELNIQS